MHNNPIYRKKYYKAHRPKELTKYQQYYAAHREEVMKKNRDYRLAHPERRRIWVRNSEIRQNGVRRFFIRLDKELEAERHRANIARHKMDSDRRKEILKILEEVYGTTELHMIRRALFWIGHYKLETHQLKAIFRKDCPICGVPLTKNNRVLDHDHKTGKIRAQICDPCNKALGFLGDNYKTAMKAAKYLKQHEVVA